MRTSSEPARASAATCRAVASTSAVSVLVIDCTAIGAPPPTSTAPSPEPMRTPTVPCRARVRKLRALRSSWQQATPGAWRRAGANLGRRGAIVIRGRRARGALGRFVLVAQMLRGVRASRLAINFRTAQAIFEADFKTLSRGVAYNLRLHDGAGDIQHRRHEAELSAR